MTGKQYPSNLYLESAATNVDFAKQVSVEAVIVMAKELLALRQRREIPEGWKLVPVEITQEMVDANFEGVCTGGIQAGYRAMLAAAPEVE